MRSPCAKACSDFLSSARTDSMIHPLHIYPDDVTTVPNMHYQTACQHPVDWSRVLDIRLERRQWLQDILSDLWTWWHYRVTKTLRHCPLNSWPYTSSLCGIIKWTTVHGKPRTRLQGRCKVSLYFHFTERWHVLRSICIVVTLEVPLSTDTNGKELGPNKLTDYVGP